MKSTQYFFFIIHDSMNFTKTSCIAVLHSLLWVNNNPLYEHACLQGVNGSVNGNSPSSVIGINTTVLSTTASSSLGQAKSTSSGGGNRKCNQEQNKNQPLDARADKIKDKVSYSLNNTQQISVFKISI